MKHITVFSLLLLPFLGCDYVEKRVTDGERADKMYREAMTEYAAGRLDKSIAGFEKLLKVSPGNASARFQLACLLQDHQKEPLGAICNYREYVALVPKGDKVALATDRMAVCERQLATLLVKKYDLGGTVAQDEMITRLRNDYTKQSETLEKTQKDLDKLKNDYAALERENARVRRMVISQASDDSTLAPSRSVTAPDEKALMEDEGSTLDRVKYSADVANLIAEEADETRETSPFGKTVAKKSAPPPPPSEPPHEARPKEYIVQEGDTLFKLAIRFYGRKSAWTTIREANKAVVSSDGRIKAGQKLKLP